MPLKKMKAWRFLSIFSVLAIVLCRTGIGTVKGEDKPNPKVDYVARFNEIGRAGRAESLNAASYYKKAFKLSVDQPQQISSSDIKGWPKDLPRDKQILLQDWVSANGEALEQLKLGTCKPYYWTEYKGSSMFGIALPDLKQARILLYAICSRAKLNASKGNFKAAFSDLLVCYRFGRHFTGPKTLIEQLAGGIGIRALVVQTAFEILDKETPAPDLLKSFQRKLQVLSAKQSHVIDFTFEKLLTYDLIQRMFTDDGRGGGHIYGIRPSEDNTYLKHYLGAQLTAEQRRGLEKLERQYSTKLADRIYKYFTSVGNKTLWELRNEGKDPEKVAKEMTKENILLTMLVPSYARALQMAYRGKTETNALITILALLRYEADRGKLPTTLQELVLTGYLKKLPMDPYSDKPLVYKRTKDNFTLYSVGADFDDDGGVPSKWGEGKQGGDQVFWPVKRGTGP